MSAVLLHFHDLAGRGVLITGGGTGIGAALTSAFAAQGARIAFIDIAVEESRALAKELSATSEHPVHFIEADLSDVFAAQAAVKEAAALLGRLDVLINNAARDDRQDLETVSEADWDGSLAVNLKPVFFTSQAAVPFMREQGGGAIVNFSSIAFMLNMGELPAYATAKAGILGLTKSLAGRLGPDNIRVNAILPGMIVTERQKRLWLTDASIAAMIERQCLKRMLVAEDLVGPTLFLASSASAAMTAQWIIVDGGIL
ncbi:NAD(P)-dependent dehydrogenase (short-subunit alcohol dehydrogenase family) [Neorhizobium huautlense]|uniref:NAD(P)-dependent dehydrogenase (Short-subunit alcohol dehydrogenase family) n=1 Tax=Neorhizobium huautlense TaxID=67774 RepID=A0ABT9PM83_9HYPH|nr:SDR family oxidoreductase [Neorhizobium huautlense]MDP9835325.1 NAD(P)-dependent dehydrogenase (short-subunit alcohol dehydrogenase family) [Neorhizobium huautlense]